MKDAWKNRSEGMLCKTCIWFAVKETEKPPDPEAPESVRGRLGRCRINAPTIKGFVPVFEYQTGCGEHRLDENQV